LDRLFDADRAALLTEVVLAVGQRFGVRFDELHNDSTSISFCDSYRAACGRKLRGRRAPAIGPQGGVRYRAMAGARQGQVLRRHNRWTGQRTQATTGLLDEE